MKTIRENWVFALLAIVAFFLVLTLFGLQSAILSQQRGVISPDAGPFYTLRQQLAVWIAPDVLSTPTTAPLTLAAATNGPVSLPTALPTATATATPIATPTLPPPASATPVPLPTITPVLLPTATATAPSPMHLAAISTEASTPAPSPVATGAGQPVSFRLGYLDRQDNCPLVTEIVRLALVARLGLTVESVAFTTSDDLFAMLAATDPQQRVDLTLCYTDPTDRAYLQKHLGFVLLVGSAYRQSEDRRFVVLSNASIKSVIQRDQPCVYSFLLRFRLAERDLAAGDAAGWLAAHERDLASWAAC
jgi:hypothetical protein